MAVAIRPKGEEKLVFPLSLSDVINIRSSVFFFFFFFWKPLDVLKAIFRHVHSDVTPCLRWHGNRLRVSPTMASAILVSLQSIVAPPLLISLPLHFSLHLSLPAYFSPTSLSPSLTPCLFLPPHLFLHLSLPPSSLPCLSVIFPPLWCILQPGNYICHCVCLLDHCPHEYYFTS